MFVGPQNSQSHSKKSPVPEPLGRQDASRRLLTVSAIYRRLPGVAALAGLLFATGAGCISTSRRAKPDGFALRPKTEAVSDGPVAQGGAGGQTEPTDDQVALVLGLSVGQIDRLHREAYLTNDDLLRLPEVKLQRAVYRLDHPKPQHPGEAALFRHQQRLDENGQIPDNALMQAKMQRDAMIAAQEQVIPRNAGLEPGAPAWRWIGPGNVGGRIRALLIHPTQTNTMWAGSVSGGIWRTDNGGQSWFPVDDFMANLAVTSLIMDPGNSNTLYAATGEGFYASISSIDGTNNAAALRGAGVFRSTDGGVTWTQLPSTANATFDYVNRVAISPTNSQHLLAATNSGLFQTTDGGNSWTFRGGTPAYDVDYHPTDGNRAICGQSNGVANWTSNNWTTQFNSLGISSSNGGRIEVAYAPSNPSIVYISRDGNPLQNVSQLARSADGGANFVIQNQGVNYLSGQGWYNNGLWVHPTNANTIIVGGIDLWRSTDAGVNLTRISDWSRVPNPGDSAHADHHVITAHPNFDGSTNRTVYFGNDGGVYSTSNVDTVALSSGWTDLNNRLGVTQFYGAAAHPTSGTVVGGTQDVGTLRFGGSTETWSTAFGGDGGFCASDPTDQNYYYGEYISGRIVRSTDGGATACYIHAPRGCVSGNGNLAGCPVGSWCGCPSGGSCFAGTNALTDAVNGNSSFITPFVLDPNNPNTMIVGAASLWRSTDVKAAQPNWFSIRGSLASFHSAVAIAPGNSDIIWVGHSHIGANGGDVYRTSNGTAATPSWTRVDTNPTALPNRWVSSIAIHPTDSNRVYVTFMGYNSNNVWRTLNNGANWTQITGSGATALPAAPVSSIAVHPTNTGWLYVGTDVGVFASTDDGATWSTTNDGPANVTVDLLFFRDSRTLIAATHGRGIFLFEPPRVSLASIDTGGAQGFVGSSSPSVSGFGQYVSFSSADSFEVGDFNGTYDVYVRDRQGNTTSRVSVATGGAEGNAQSSANAISADGQIVAFFSLASNLVVNDNNVAADIFVRDRQSATTSRVSVASDGSEANGSVNSRPAISADGRFVAFDNTATNLVPNNGDTNGGVDVFVHDRQTGTTTRVSVASGGGEANGNSDGPSISGDGRYVAFDSNAANLVTGDSNGNWDIFVHDRKMTSTIRVSVTSSGGEASGFTVRPQISADGRFVLFETDADYASGADTNGLYDVYLHDRDADGNGTFDEAGGIATTRVSVSSAGAQGNANSGVFGRFSISSNGRWVVFESAASNLVASDTNSASDIFLYDRVNATTERISVDSTGAQGVGGNSIFPAMSCNGGVVAFASFASNLVSNDMNGTTNDVFVEDRLFGTGDVNLDGSVNGSDSQAFLAVLLGNDTNVARIAEADLNRDGRVDLADSAILTQRLLGLCP